MMGAEISCRGIKQLILAETLSEVSTSKHLATAQGKAGGSREAACIG